MCIKRIYNEGSFNYRWLKFFGNLTLPQTRNIITTGYLICLLLILTGCGGSPGETTPIIPTPDDPTTVNPDNPQPITPDPGGDPIEDPFNSAPPVELQFDNLNTQVDPALVGSWTTITGVTEELIIFNDDATCYIHTISYGIGEAKVNCRWGVIDQGQELSLIIESANNIWTSYGFEKPTTDTFRLSGGNLGLISLLYSRSNPATLTGKFPGRWMVGTWALWPFVFTKHYWHFGIDGSLIIDSRNASDNAFIQSSSGTWDITPTHLIYQIDESTKNIELPSSGTWKLTELDINTFALDGAYNLPEYFRRQSIETFRAQAFVGQHMGPETTLTISHISNQDYRVKILHVDQLYDVAALAVNGQLQIELPLQFQEAGEPYLVLADTFNGMNAVRAPIGVGVEWPNFYKKMSDTSMIPPSQIAGGAWIGESKFSSSVDQYLLLTDGKYIYTSGSVREEGVYQLSNGQFTIDPMCKSPAFANYTFTENHWALEIAKIGGGTFKSVYQYQPNSNHVIDAYTQQFNAGREKTNSEWRARIPTGSIDPNNVPLTTIVTNRGPVTVGPDLTPGDVIAGATVFQEVENFHWIEPFPSCNPLRVDLCDTAYFVFHANGRVLYYSEAKFGIDIVSGQPIGSSNYFWLPYAIEGQTIKIGDSVSIDIIGGRRRVRMQEWCFDNSKWITAP